MSHFKFRIYALKKDQGTYLGHMTKPGLQCFRQVGEDVSMGQTFRLDQIGTILSQEESEFRQM